VAEQRNLLHEIADYADELTDSRRNTERIATTDKHRHRRVRDVWVTKHPSLLQQLEYAVEPGETLLETEETTGGGTSFESRPAARLDAINELQRIQRETAAWCVRARVSVRGTPTGNVRALVGAAALMGSTDQRALAADLRRWRTAAATITGWERPPVAPRTTCPICAARNTIRVRLDEKTGLCVACGETWDSETVGLLAEHIRLDGARTTRDAAALRARAVAARRAHDAARAGHERKPDLPYICPGCGTRPCRNLTRCPKTAKITDVRSLPGAR
jgi:hypothetical protein